MATCRRGSKERRDAKGKGGRGGEITACKSGGRGLRRDFERKKAHNGSTTEGEEKKAQRDALLNRFAYEKEEDGDNEGGPVSNKDAAAEAQREHAEKVREQSSKSRESKADARQKNKDAMKLKADKKEERRKKATKGERKR